MHQRVLPPLTAAALIACGAGGDPSADDAVIPHFSDRASAAGIDFVHVNGMTGQLYEAEIMGAGAALFDYDNDGDLDVYLVQGGTLAPSKSVETAAPHPITLRDRLYRSDVKGGGGALSFTDVTTTALPELRSYGMGVATGDFDNDGWIDLYLTRLGETILLRNTGSGTFTDVTRSSRTGTTGWNIPAAFVDVDRDGWLDLFVGGYLDYRIESDVACRNRSGVPDYCDPSAYRPARQRLYRNLRDGTFEDITTTALRGDSVGTALGVSTFDANDDGWIDIYVANDRRENHLWVNQRDGTFRNIALFAGVAVNGSGNPEASMGVDAGDMDNDGDEDLVIANLASEGATLYVNDGSGSFDDAGAAAGLRPASLSYTGFGAAWFDFDNDGWLDVLIVNGEVQTIEALARTGDPFPLHQHKQLFRNRRNSRFEDVSSRAGPAFLSSEVGRGAAFGDVDNDGDIDVLVNVNNGRAQLLVNDGGHSNHWIGLRLVDSRRRRDMLGATVEIERQGRRIVRRARADGSYASANDPRVLVGLGPATDAPAVRVTWPDGRVEAWARIPVDRWTTLIQGMGQ